MNEKQKRSLQIITILVIALLVYIGFREPNYQPMLTIVIAGLFIILGINMRK